MKLKILSLLTMILAFAVMPALAQNLNVKGLVIDEQGEPVIGASVIVTGTTIGTSTDLEGRFEFSNLKPTYKTVTVSYIGMETVKADIKPEMTVVMREHTEMMQEVVVVAFGEQKREAFTGSAAVIKSDEITMRQANNPIASLEGKVPGLTMLQSNNPASDGTSSINIRGLGSINAKTAPLVILDGQPYDGAWRDINPADVDNISVLKDAASNALYGARGANGVIMITTKNAQKGKTRVTFDAKWGANTDARIDYDVIDNPAEYYEAHYAALNNYLRRSLGQTPSEAFLNANSILCGSDTDAGGLGYILYSVPNGQTLIGSNGRLNPNAMLGNRVYNNGQVYTLVPDDWKAHGLRTGFRQEYNMTLTGGADSYSSYFSLGYLSDEGISYGSDLQRFSTRFKSTYNPYSWAKVGANANYSHSDYNNMNGAFETVHNLAPIYPLFLRDGYGNVLTDEHGPRYDYGDGTVGFVRVVEKNGNSIQSDKLDQAKRSSNAFTLNGYANIEFLKDFKLTINGGVNFNEYRYTTAYNPYYGYTTTSGGSVSTAQSRTVSTNFQQLLNWNHSFGMHTVEALLGHEYNRRSLSYISGGKTQVAIYDENTELNGAIINGSLNGYKELYNVEGWFLRAQYDYDNRYFASASFRRDGSSRFHPKHRWGNFWSVGGAWIISKESWFPQNSVFDMLKFKASYGSQGNDGLSSSFYWTDYYTITNSNDNVAYDFRWKGNPDITWETTGNFNTGFEFEMFYSRLSGTIEYYNRKTSDMLYYKVVPSSLGYSGYYDNIGDMVNNGIEVTLNGSVIRTSDLTLDLNVNFAWEKNKVTYLPETSKGLVVDGHSGYQSEYFFCGEGLPYYTWYIPVYAGPNEQGQPTWKVTNKDGSEGVTSTYDKATYYNCGTALPDAYGGFGLAAKWKGFDLTANFTFTIGGKKLDYGYLSIMGSPYGSTIGMNIHRDALAGWSEENVEAWIPRWQYNDTQNNMTSDFFLVDGSQLTFKMVQLGYTLPRSVTSKLKMQSMRFYFTVDNVAYWTKRKGFDPRGDRTSFSADGYSPMRTFVGGFNITF